MDGVDVNRKLVVEVCDCYDVRGVVLIYLLGLSVGVEVGEGAVK